MIALIAALVVGQVVLKDEGTTLGPVNSINCVGSGVACTRTGSAGTVTASGVDGGSVTSVSVTTQNGVSATVTNPTTTPALAFTLGAITPSSVAASGTVTGSNLSGTNTGDQTKTCGAGDFIQQMVAGTGSVCGTPSSGAPTSAQYWVGAADGTLSAEKDLGALSTGLVINTAGVPSAFAGTSCTNQFPRSLSASGAATCASVAIADHSATGTPSATTFLRGDNTWSTPSGTSPLTTKGDIYVYSTVDTRLPTSTDGLCLKTNSAAGTGLEWASCSAGGGISYAEAAAAVMGGF